MREVRGALRFAMPVFMSISQEARTGSWSDDGHALVGVRPCCALPALTASAQATWADPGPWQASQETSSSDQVVA